jgi:hypothetical protein
MKHAGPDALDQLEPILAELRKLPELRERTRGAFYLGSVGFLHFHEDPAGFFADLKIDGEFVRLPTNNQKELATLIRRVAAEVKAVAARRTSSA